MGLDSVELLMDVEDTLGIEISNLEAEKIDTVQDFYDCAWKHVSNKKLSIEKCYTQSVFYKIRQAIVENIKVDKASITPKTKIADIIPFENRRKIWQQLEDTLQLKLPQLELRKPYNIILNAFGIKTILGSLLVELFMVIIYDASYWFYGYSLIAILLTSLLSKAFTPFRTKFVPSDFGELTKNVYGKNFKAITNEKGITKNDLEIVIREIISNKMGIDLAEITPEKSLTRDLGID